MRLGLEAVGGRCVYSCERDKFARETYLSNFESGAHPFDHDINDVDPNEIRDHDLLAAGFPCQPFSVAGVSKKNALGLPHGFNCKEQGNLFFKIRDILIAKKPAAFILENVKNLQSHDRGNTFKVIEGVLKKELGYQLQTRVINAKGWLPQNRERIFMVGFREANDFDFTGMHVKHPDKGPTLASILHTEDGTESCEPPYTNDDELKTVNLEKYRLTRHLWTYLKDYAKKHRALGNGFGYGKFTPDQKARTLSARYYKDGSEILIDRGGNKYPRRLTPRECARLMGFEDPFSIPVSDTQAYRQFGNAVAVPVVTAIAKYMLRYLSKTVDSQQPPLPNI
tara:strand:+ start:511 stop:1524 length:1014 start_codon:yes stop_codon:yes gene_type:complete